jgi:hypothetical protein
MSIPRCFKVLGVLFLFLAPFVAHASALERWSDPDLEQMLHSSEQTQILPETLFAKIKALYAAKCAVHHESKPCFVTEKEAGLGPNSEKILLFRGEPGSYDLPMTAPVVRDALKGNSICGDRCDSKKLSQNLFAITDQLIKKVSKEMPRFYGGHTFVESQKTWDLTNDNSSNPLFEDKKKASSLEVLVNSHFRGSLQTLNIEHAGGVTGSLDPFVSFTSSPDVAAKFSRTYEGRGQIWLVSIPEKSMKVVSGGKCRSRIDTVAFYDLSACSRPRIYKGEKEFDAFLFPPAAAIKGRFRH